MRDSIEELRKKGLELTRAELIKMPISELAALCQILGRSGRGTRNELIQSILRAQKTVVVNKTK